MIIYLLSQGFDAILSFIISLLPTIEAPSWLTTALPNIFTTIMGFNLYLPVSEAIIAILVCITFTASVRVFSIVASKIGLSI